MKIKTFEQFNKKINENFDDIDDYSLKNVNSNDIVQDYGGRKTKTFEL